VDSPFFVPGEEMVWELSLRGITGGDAVMAMGEPGMLDGRHVIVVRSRMQTIGLVKAIKEVKDDVTTWIDLDSSLPIALEGELKFGKRETKVKTRFGPNSFDIDYQRGKKPWRKKHQEMPDGIVTYDAHSVLGALRAWTPEDGDRAYFYVLGGRRIWHNTVRFTGREPLKTSLGMHPAIRIDGVATKLTSGLKVDKRKKARTYTVWFSDDANRAPLLLTARTEYGMVRAELTSYDRPDRRISRR